MKSACCANILLNLFYQEIIELYGMPKPTLAKGLRNIYPLLK